jgi:signal transduction histidine kinase/FixJ family two-component response regulator
MVISALAISFLFWRFENARKVNAIILAEQQAMHQNEERLQAYADETASLYRKLDGAARQVGELMRCIVDNKDYSVRFVNPLLVRCWEITQCHHTTCPVYGRSEGRRCWETTGTLCRCNAPEGDAEKPSACRTCKVYQAARKDSMSFLGESFNEMIVMIADRERALVAANQRLEEANTQAREMTLRAEAATRAKSEFLANMSHEIRTPMTAILGYTNILLGSTKNPEHLEALNIVRRNSDHLLTVINDILDLSKIEVGKLEVERVACPPLRVVTEVVSLMRVWAAEKKVPLKLEFDGPCPEKILTDHTRLRQVLFNLVGNAIKFTETGEVRIIVRLLATNTPQPKICFDVVDTGVGMAADQIDKLFQPFQQADASTTRKFGGTGLGLVISKRLAKLLGGDIIVSSELGKGSTFTVTVDTGPLTGVPLIEHPAEAVADTVAAAVENNPPARLTCRVLLAEDGPDNQRLISLLLKKAGAQVTVVENGKRAMELALATFPGWGRRHGDCAQSFDVILMDMQMPVMDGYEATRRLRAEGYNLPIIALTAHAMEEDMRKCLDAGCDAYLSKPIHREMFLATVAEYAARGQCESGQSPMEEPKPSGQCAS